MGNLLNTVLKDKDGCFSNLFCSCKMGITVVLKQHQSGRESVIINKDNIQIDLSFTELESLSKQLEDCINSGNSFKVFIKLKGEK